MVQFCKSAQLIALTTITTLVLCFSGCGPLVSGPSSSAVVSLSAVVFANVIAGTSSSAQAVILSNTSNTVLDIDSIALSGTTASSFSESNNCPEHLAAGNTCS